MESYEEWDMTIPPILSRSRLYHLEPIGVGTPYVESLTSYVIRLANAHHVFPGILINKEVFPLVPGYVPSKKQYGVFVDGSGQSMRFNGAGLPATYAVRALENLTSRADLSYLTCLPLAGILSAKARLIRMSKAWCSICYEEQRASSQIIYEPLLWSFQAVSICSRHRVYLSSLCPYQNCAKALPGIGWRSRVGYCSYCQRWLGSSLTRAREISSSLEGSELSWQLWVIKALEDMFIRIPAQLERQRISQVVTYIVQSTSSGNLSAFARSVDMSRNMIDYWYQGKKLPELDTLLRFCFRLGLSLEDFFFLELATLRPNLRELVLPVSVAPRKKLVIQTESIYNVLQVMATSNEYPPPTLREVAYRVERTPQILRHINFVACQKIVNRHRAYVQQRKEARYQRLQGEIRRIAFQLLSEGVLPTRKQIASFLPQPGILRDRRILKYLREICQEFEKNN